MMRARILAESHWGVLAVFAVAVLAVLVFWVFFPPSFWQGPLDSTEAYAAIMGDYQTQVRDLLEGRGLVNFRYPPVFPLILAGLYHLGRTPALPLTFFVLVCAGLSAVLIFVISRRLWGALPAFGAAVLWSVYPPALYSATYPSSEILFSTVLYAAFGVLLLRILLGAGDLRLFAGWAVLCGTLLGLAMLIRPIAIAMGVIVAVFVWLARRDLAFRWRWGLVGLILLGNLIVVLPWEGWALAGTGTVIPLSTGGVPSMLDGLSDAVDPTEARRIDVPDDVRVLQQDIYDQQYNELNSFGKIAVYLVEQLESRPGAVIKLFLIKLVRSWYATDSTRYDALILLVQIPFLALLLLGMFLAIRRKGIHRQVAALVLVSVLYFWAMTVIALSIVRYMTPAIGLMFLLVGGVWSGLVTRMALHGGVASTDETLLTTDRNG